MNNDDLLIVDELNLNKQMNDNDFERRNITCKNDCLHTHNVTSYIYYT